MFIDNVDDYISRNKITVNAFEKSIRVATGTVDKWRKFNRLPSANTLLMMEQATGIPIKRWLEGEKPKVKEKG